MILARDDWKVIYQIKNGKLISLKFSGKVKYLKIAMNLLKITLMENNAA